MKLFYVDVETNGLNSGTDAILQISGIVRVNGKDKEKFNIFVRPHDDQEINEDAAKVHGITQAAIDAEPDKFVTHQEAYAQLIEILSQHVDKYDKTDKFFFVGYNCNTFDMPFLRRLFARNGDKYFGSWFYYPSIDVCLIAAFELMKKRDTMQNFKLLTVARALDIEVDDDKAHDAMYDIEITREILKRLHDR
jgi:DNA polymerase-3 subunit epsilon